MEHQRLWPVLTVMLMLPCILLAQDYSIHEERLRFHSPLNHSNIFKLNIAKLFHLEFVVAYERKLSNRWYWETEAGWIFGLKHADAHSFIDYPFYNYNGFTSTIFPKYYFSYNSYLGPVVMYKNLWFKGVRTNWHGGKGYDGGQLQDQYREDLGISFRYGFMRSYNGFIFDLYAGLGVKGIWLRQLVYGYYLHFDSSKDFRYYHADHSPKTYDKVLIYPIVNFGIKFGFGF